ncbi:MAG: HAD-IA family hydrolase [Candidatus Jorgensenbacteria bacterium]
MLGQMLQPALFGFPDLFMSTYKHVFKVPERRLKNIRGVLLDLDNTLYSYDMCHEAAMKSSYISVRRAINISFEEFKKRYNVSRQEIKKWIYGRAASHSRLLYFQNLFEHYFGVTRAWLTLKAERAYWNGFFKKMKPYSGVRDFLIRCRKNGVAVCLVTDLTAEIQLRKIICLKIANLIDLVVSSEEAGADKPHKSMYILALKKLGCSPKEVILVGDDDCNKKDIRGAKAIGIRAILANK